MEYFLLILGIVVNIPLGIFAYYKRALTLPGGLVTAGTMGYVLFIIQPLYWVLLLVFFGSSTLLTRFKAVDPVKIEALSLAEKGGQRDSFQVLANGGIPLLLAVIAVGIAGSFPLPDLTRGYSVAIAIAFAVVNADTWATELGVTSNDDPYWILNPTKKVPRGTSGGVSPRGFLASFLATLLIVIIYAIGLVINDQFQYQLLVVVVAGGMLGSILDSLLGATIQAQYYCETCDKLTEQSPHEKCGTYTYLQRGYSWFSNDLVNLFSVIFAILIILPFFW